MQFYKLESLYRVGLSISDKERQRNDKRVKEWHLPVFRDRQAGVEKKGGDWIDDKDRD
jgi:hypothetical protein